MDLVPLPLATWDLSLSNQTKVDHTNRSLFGVRFEDTHASATDDFADFFEKKKSNCIISRTQNSSISDSGRAASFYMRGSAAVAHFEIQMRRGRTASHSYTQ